MTAILREVRNTLEIYRLESERLTVTVVPGIGAKVLSLVDKPSDRTLLWENPRIRPQRFSIDGSFDNHWCGGWDEVFPTADACTHGNESYPNMGELRSLEWKVDRYEANAETARIELSVLAPISAVRASKIVSLTGDQLSVHFRIECLGPLPLDFLWGSHPALAVTSNSRILIPGGKGIVAQASAPSLGVPGETYTWPHLRDVDMSRVQGIEAGVACGHYVTELKEGWFAVEDDALGLIFEFPLERCPHLWLWLVYGGWRGYHHAIVEPWTGYPVNLDDAAKAGRSTKIMPGEVFEATVRCATYKPGPERLEALARLKKASGADLNKEDPAQSDRMGATPL